MGIRLAQRSIDRITHKIRRLTRRNVGQSLEQIRDRLNPVIIGWTNYFALADARRYVQRFDEHLRRRLRQIVWKQWKTPKRRRKQLIRGGVGRHSARRVAGTRRGPWVMSHSKHLQIALDDAFFAQLGLVRLAA